MKRSVAVIAGVVFCARVAWADEVTVAVAANFTAPMQRIAAAFEQDSGHKTKLIFGASGKFYAQIKSGAPFHVFLSADTATPARLERDGAAVSGTRFTYAVGKLALWSARPDVVDADGAVLRRGAFKRLALANPRIAPYGAAAIEVLTHLDLLAALAPKFVQGENIAQTYQFVASGNAELGFVALSQVLQDGRLSGGSVWIVPPELSAPIRQDAVLLAVARDQPAAAALLQFLRGERARSIIAAYGYALPAP